MEIFQLFIKINRACHVLYEQVTCSCKNSILIYDIYIYIYIIVLYIIYLAARHNMLVGLDCHIQIWLVMEYFTI